MKIATNARMKRWKGNEDGHECTNERWKGNEDCHECTNERWKGKRPRMHKWKGNEDGHECTNELMEKEGNNRPQIYLATQLDRSTHDSSIKR